jgi:hypothetical protein
VTALAGVEPAARRLMLLAGPELGAGLFGDVAPELEVVPAAPEDMPPDLDLADGPVLVVDAAAPALGTSLKHLLGEPEGSCLVAPDGIVAAAHLSAADARALLLRGGDLSDPGRTEPGPRRTDSLPEAVVVHDRCTLARATRLIRDRIIERQMANGVTFLIPESVIVDVDVQIGRDTVVYPGVVLEGQTVVGQETVLGPGCRVIDSWIGSGVELKGWNFVSRSSIRNRAILEPYVRRGFD